MEILRVPTFNERRDDSFVVIEWRRNEGMRVKNGQGVVTVEGSVTFFGGDELDMQIEIAAATSGTLLKILAPKGQRIPAGAGIALIGEIGEALPEHQDDTPIPPDPAQEPSPLQLGRAPSTQEETVRWMRMMNVFLGACTLALAVLIVFVVLSPTLARLTWLAYTSVELTLMAILRWSERHGQRRNLMLSRVLVLLMIAATIANFLWVVVWQR